MTVVKADERGPQAVAGAVARERFTAGENCAQAVAEALGSRSGAGLAGFTMGVGASGCACGALIAGVQALSAAVEAEGADPDATRQRAEALAGQFHDAFRARWGSTCCRILKRGQLEGSDAWNAHCAEITEFAAALAEELARDGRRRRWAPRDVVEGARRASLDALASAACGTLVALTAPAFGTAPIAMFALAGLLIGAGLELGGGATRRGGRLVRVVGASSAAISLVWSALVPQAATGLVSGLFAPGDPVAFAARVGLAAIAAVPAALAVFGFKRYR